MHNVILGLWQFLLVFAVGLPLERRLRLSLPYGYRMAVAFGLGETLISYGLFLLGLLGGLRFWVLVPLAVVGTITLFPRLGSETRRLAGAIASAARKAPLTSAAVFLMLVVFALGASVPEREEDAVWYHLAVPFYYITHGGSIQLVPFNMPSHYPMNGQLHYTFSLLVGNDTTAKVFSLCHLIPLLILLWSVTKRYGAEEWGMFAVAVYLSCVHFRLPVMANVQRTVYLYVFLSTALLWEALERNHRPLLLLAALFCGMAMGTKHTAILFAYGAQALLLLGWLVFSRKQPLRNRAKILVLHGVVAWSLFTPWMIKSFVYTGNPFYPVLGEPFATRPEFVPGMLANQAVHSLNPMESETIEEFLKQVEANVRFMLYKDDLIFSVGAVSVVFVLLFRRMNAALPVASGLIMYLLFTMLWGSDRDRIFGLSYGILVLLIALLMDSLGRQLVRRPFLRNACYAVVLLSFLATSAKRRYFYLTHPNINWQGQVRLSAEARDQWLVSRGITRPELLEMRDWIKENLPREEDIYGYRAGYLFHLNHKYVISGLRYGEELHRWLQRGPEYAARRFDETNLRWILVGPSSWERPSVEVDRAWDSFVAEYLEEVHREGVYTLYRLRGPRAGSPVSQDEAR